MYYQPLRVTPFFLSFFCILNYAGAASNAGLYLLEDRRKGRWDDRRCFLWHGKTVKTLVLLLFPEESKIVGVQVGKAL